MQQTSERPLVLITNDDGYQARGLAALTRVIGTMADVIVAAPDRGNSGKSHSITVMQALTAKRLRSFDGALEAYAISGTPVDCVKLAVHTLVPRRPDFVLSGINHGSNTSASVHYSGTLGAAREGALLGIPSVGFSLASYDPEADIDHAAQIAAGIFGQISRRADALKSTYLNVNIPTGRPLGIRTCRMVAGHWNEMAHHFKDPFGTHNYWLDGEYVNDEPDARDTDEYWLAQNYATVTPCRLDVTDYDLINCLKSDIDTTES